MIDDYVFHYTKATTALEKILFEQRLKLSQFAYTNDPKESKERLFAIFTGIDPSTNMRTFDEFIVPQLKYVKRQEWKVLCVSQNHMDIISGKVSEQQAIADDPLMLGCCLPSMWAHYGSEKETLHSGVCLRLNFNKLNDTINNTFSDNDKYNIHNGMVVYNNKALFKENPINLSSLSTFDKDKHIEIARNYFFSNWYDEFFLKSEDWRSENEYRWIVHSELNDAEFISLSGVLDSVYVGEGLSEAYYPSLELLCKKLDVEPLKIGWRNGVPYVTSIHETRRLL